MHGISYQGETVSTNKGTHSSTHEYKSVPAWQTCIVQQGLCMEQGHRLVSSRSYRSLPTARCEGKEGHAAQQKCCANSCRVVSA